MTDLREELQAALGGAYTLDRELGGGGMSRLFLAEDHALRRTVVIKLLPPALASGLTVERFRREMLLVARLQHPHIVPVIGSGAVGDTIWYVMPYVQGESLRHRLERDGALPVDEAVALLREIADALAYAHRAGVVHRDIKPGNVLLSEGHAVLADFGIAQAHGLSGDRVDSTNLTATGIGLGTPRYMAPEQFMEAANVDARADVYSLGMLAYEMLTGRTAFDATTGPELLVAHMQQTPVPPSKIRPEISKSLSTAVLRAVAKDPAERWQTADDFKRALGGSQGRRQRVPRLRRTQRIAALVLGGAVCITAVKRLPARASAPHPGLDANIVAVAPFTVLVPQMSMWREGMVDILSRSLDGWGPLRTVPPSTVIKLPFPTADAASATSLADGAKAGVVVFGTLYQSGPDSIRASVTVLNGAKGTVIAEFERRDQSTRMERLTDSITTGVLSAVGAARGLSILPRPASIGSSSIAAIKEFVIGERMRRSGELDSAAVHYQRAITIDSNFALAWHEMGHAIGWTRGGGSPESIAARFRAGALNHGRSPHDSLTLVADSIWGALDSQDPRITRRFASRIFSTLDKLTQDYPSDADAWYLLGDARVHFGFAADAPPTPLDVLDAFDRAISLDAGLLEAYVHATEFALYANDVARARSYAERLLRVGASSQYADGARNFLELTKQPYDEAALERLVRRMDGRQAWITALVGFIGTAYVDSSATMARLYRAAAALPADGESVPIVLYKRELARELAEHGQLRDARAAVKEPSLSREIALARLGVRNADSVSHATAGTYLAEMERRPFPRYALDLWATHGDTAVVLRIMKEASRPPRSRGDSVFLGAQLHYLTAVLALARHDSARAAALLDTFPMAPAYWREESTRLRGRLLIGSAPIRAARVLGARVYRATEADNIEAMESLLFAARAAARAGDVPLARLYYTRIATAWVHADPELRQLEAEALQAIRGAK